MRWSDEIQMRVTTARPGAAERALLAVLDMHGPDAAKDCMECADPHPCRTVRTALDEMERTW